MSITEFSTTNAPHRVVSGGAASAGDAKLRPEFEHIGDMALPDSLSLSIRKPAYSEVGKPAKVLLKLPDGRMYLANISTPARGAESMDTSFTGALNGGFWNDDIFKFLEQLYGLTDYTIGDCFRLFEKDMISFVGRVVLRDTTILATHESATPATEEACLGLKEIQRWVRQELPAAYGQKENIAALSASIAKLLEKHESRLGPDNSSLVQRGLRRSIPQKAYRKPPWVF